MRECRNAGQKKQFQVPSFKLPAFPHSNKGTVPKNSDCMKNPENTNVPGNANLRNANLQIGPLGNAARESGVPRGAPGLTSRPACPGCPTV